MSTTLENFAYDQLPKTWEDYHGQYTAKILARRFLLDKPSQSLFISGISGVGKTAFVLLLIKSFRCLNRKPHEINPCNKCAACLESDARLADQSLTDVYWLQEGATAETSLNTRVKAALTAAEKGHRFRGKGNKDVLFIVCDEFQRFPVNIRQKLLFNVEVPDKNSNVCYIFITMQEDVLSKTERIAFTRRGEYLKLIPFSEEKLIKFIKDKFPFTPNATANIIASCSENSPGLAISLYHAVANIDPELDPDVAALILNLANNKYRLNLWTHCQAKRPVAGLRKQLQYLSKYVSPNKLANQLIDDILNSCINSPTDEQLFALRVLNQFQSNYLSTQLLPYLVELYGLNVVDENLIMNIPDGSLKYALD